jgi:sec-independent protein translocase protein TatB
VFNIGPLELIVLALVALVVIGPDKLPSLARDAARMLRELRDMATGAKQQLRDELGPEFADVDLRNLNPRTAVQRAVFGDDVPDLSKYDPRRLNPGAAVRDAIFGDPPSSSDPASSSDADSKPVSMTKSGRSTNGASPDGAASNGARPRPRPRPRTAYDEDAT